MRNACARSTTSPTRARSYVIFLSPNGRRQSLEGARLAASAGLARRTPGRAEDDDRALRGLAKALAFRGDATPRRARARRDRPRPPRGTRAVERAERRSDPARARALAE